MKMLRITALGAALLFAAAPMAHAQGGQSGGENGGAARGANRMMEMMFKGIDLTDAQKAQIQKIQDDYRAKMPARTPGQAPDPADRQKRRELMQSEQKEIRDVLTPDQQKVYDKNMEDMRNNMRRGGPGR
ncbi:MAG TPA: Spy/CpxP family protein refolding chaperone [Gemmatimonadaceae bacterium]|nr:Spy/CpxP family protein refolding chaperone [Gemmatimonadaceae bacterium]